MVLGLVLLFSSDSVLAELKFDKEKIEDVIFQNTGPYIFIFKFKNESTVKTKIKKIETTCSCTVATLDKKAYAYNDSGEIKGRFNIAGKVGRQEQSIIVHTDDISQSQIKLLLKIKILNPVEIKPRLVYWEKGTKLETKIITLTIIDSKWKIDSISCDESKFTIKCSEENGKYTIAVTPVSTDESLRDVIKIKLKDDKGSSKTFVVHALVKAEV